MTSLQTPIAVPSREPRKQIQSCIWGLSELELHDHLWSERGIHVIRRGKVSVEPLVEGPFLLLEAGECVFFELDSLPRSLQVQFNSCKQSWLRRHMSRHGTRHGPVLPFRVMSESDERYNERVVIDDLGEMTGIERCFDAGTPSDREVLLTASTAMAERWASTTCEGTGWRDVLDVSSRKNVYIPTISGELCRADDTKKRGILVGRLMRGMRGINVESLGATQIAPDVWTHKTTRIKPGTRLIGPVLAGKGVHIDSSRVIVGPCVYSDTDDGIATEDALRVITPLNGARDKQLPDGMHVSKRMFDIVFSSLAIMISLPISGLIMLAIFIEAGRPIFFHDVRQTVFGRSFHCWKFRTMRTDAVDLKSEMSEQNECGGPHFYVPKDPRTFRVGRILRRCHLDELPQLYNVFLGDMSIVGPRPSPNSENQFCPAWREARLSMRAGMTGLWQVHRQRRPDTDFQEWIRYDLEYVRNWSWKSDIWIMLCTPVVVLARAAGLPKMLGGTSQRWKRRMLRKSDAGQVSIDSKILPDVDVESKMTTLS